MATDGEGGPKADDKLEPPAFEAGAGHVPVPDPTDERPVFEAGAGRGGVAAGAIVSPHPDGSAKPGEG